MTIGIHRKKICACAGQFLAVLLCVLLLAPADSPVFAARQNPSGDQAAPVIPNDQLDSLVAPIALYPDPLLSQVLVASTYPLEIIQLQQWLEKHKDLKGDSLVAAVQMQDWDPSIQAMAALPDAVKQLAENIKWTTDLGNAFLAQQSDVMDAVQRMRRKAQEVGSLKSTEQQTVETKTVESKTVVVIQQANPQVIYVPSYNPVVVYGPPIYPYPAIYYPPPSYYAAGVFIGFGVGVAMGSYYRGGWGYNCGWGRYNNVNININNNYIRHYNNTNVNVNRNNFNNRPSQLPANGNRNNAGNRPSQLPANGGNTWQHNPQHRGGAPYSNKATATKYGGTARGDSMSTRQANARQQQGTAARQLPDTGNRQQPAAANRQLPGAGNGAAGGANRAGSNPAANPGAAGANRGNNGGNNIGNRQIPSSNQSGKTGAFGGSSSKGAAQASGARGASSMGASRSGGAARSGGGGRRK